MPTFQGQVTEEQILALTEYIKSLPAAPAGSGGTGGAGPSPATPTPGPTK